MFDSCLSEFGCRRRQGKIQRPVKTLLNGLWLQINTARLSSIINLVISESRNFPEIARHYYELCIVRGRALLRSVIERGIARNEFQNVDIESTINIAVAPIVMQVVWRYSFLFCEPEMDTEAYLGTHLKLLIEGLEKRPANTGNTSSKNSETLNAISQRGKP